MFGKKNMTLEEEAHRFVLRDFTPHFGRLQEAKCDNPLWQRLRDLHTELWLDTGNIPEVAKYMSRQFVAVTTNNTLLNKEVQGGQYDQFIAEAGDLLRKHDISERRRRLELAFMLNARHALRLVEKFDAYVSVEEHTDLAYGVGEAMEYARRYYAVCPERFFVKIPFTPAGLLATRIASQEGIPINHTLGFSARQNYVIARIGRPQFVNVFLGRLNQFVVDNNLGDGRYVGEKATLASQCAISGLRREKGLTTRQIAASFRSGQQVRDLAGVDVMTMPAKVAKEFLSLQLSPEQVVDRTAENYDVRLNEGVDPAAIRFDSLWEINDRLVKTVDELEGEDLSRFGPSQLVEFFAERGCGDFMVKWNADQIGISTAEGKVPRLENWRQLLLGRVIGLDSLMNLSGLCSFANDQKEMDEHVQKVLHDEQPASHR